MCFSDGIKALVDPTLHIDTEQWDRLIERFPAKVFRERTMLEIMEQSHHENTVSNILKFFLKPDASHDLGSLFLSALVNETSADEVVLGENVVVHREYTTKNKGRIDLLVITETHSIIIENKIFHHLDNDLLDYYDTVQSESGRAILPILLTLNPLNKKDGIKFKKVNKELGDSGRMPFHHIQFGQYFQSLVNEFPFYEAGNKYSDFARDFITSILNLKNAMTELTPASLEYIKTNWEELSEIQSITKKIFDECTKKLKDVETNLKGKLPAELQKMQIAESQMHKKWSKVLWIGEHGKEMVKVRINPKDGYQIEIWNFDANKTSNLRSALSDNGETFCILGTHISYEGTSASEIGESILGFVRE